MFSQLLTAFATIPDPRCAGRTRHRLLDMLVIAICAVVAGAALHLSSDFVGLGF